MVVDLHSDLLIDLWARRLQGERDVFRRRHLSDLTAAGVRVQVLAVYVETAMLPEGALRQALRLIDTARREEEESEGALRIVTTQAGLDAALADDAFAAILSLEGAEPLGRDPELAYTFAQLGIRLIGPTWNRANDFADGAAEDRGIGFTPLGRRLMQEMAACGMGLDISHLTKRAALQALQRYEGPVLASHSNAAAVYANPRNLDDDVLRALAARGGVCGVNFLPVFAGPGDNAERLAAHAAHIAAIAGDGAPACGADLVSFLPPGLPEPVGVGLPVGSDRDLFGLPEPARETAYAELIRHLLLGGHSEAVVRGVIEDNALRFLRTVLP